MLSIRGTAACHCCCGIEKVEVHQSCSLKHRKPREDHLHIDAGVERRAVGVGDVLVLVADGEAAAVAVDDLDSAAEIKGEVETRGAG